VCFLALEVCLGCHVGPSILVLARDWPGVCHLAYTCSFHAFSVQIYLHTYLDQHLWDSSHNNPILILARASIPFLCRI
jgi:hypothetical protein